MVKTKKSQAEKEIQAFRLYDKLPCSNFWDFGCFECVYSKRCKIVYKNLNLRMR